MNRSFLRPVLLVVAGLVLAALTGWCAVSSFYGIDNYQSPHAGSPLRSPPGPPMSDAVVMIVVDGLRLDHAPLMESYVKLSADWATLVADCELPSLSQVAAATLGTGASSEVHGITSNETGRLMTVDSLFRSAASVGVPTVTVSTGGWDALFRDDIGRRVTVVGDKGSGDPEVARRAAAFLAEDAQGLIIIHFDEVDAAGHAYGAVSEGYRAAIARVDRLVLGLLPMVDLERMTLIMISDHGHIDSGNHAGSEPEVVRTPVMMAGAGIRPGEYRDARHVDIAPTIAALLGIPQPTQADGRILAELLEAPSLLSLQGSAMTAAAFTGQYGKAMGSDVDAAEIAAASSRPLSSVDEYGERMKKLADIRANARSQYLWGRRLARLPVGLLLVVGLAAGCWATIRRYRWWVLMAPIHTLLAVGLVYAQGLRYSLSLFNSYDAAIHFFLWRLTEGVVLAGVLVLAAVRSRRLASRQQAAADAVGLCFVITAWLGLQAAAYYVAHGIEFYAVMPSLDWGMKFFSDVVQIVGLGIATPLIALAATLLSVRRERVTG